MLWLGRSISSLGDRLVEIALVFTVLGLRRQPSDVAVVLAANLVPRVLLTLAGGVWGDRLPRDRIMIVSDLVRAAAQATTAVLLFTGSARLWHLVVLAALHGIAASFFAPASSGVIPETVEPDLRLRANALMNVSRNGVSVAMPAVAGILVAWLGPAWVFTLDAASFVASAAFLSTLRLPPRAVAGRAFLAELRNGWEEVASRPWLRWSLAYFASWNLAVAPVFVLGPYVAAQHLGGASGWGIVMSGAAAGTVGGSLVALRLSCSRPLLVAYVALLIAFLPSAALAVPLGLWAILVSMLLMTTTMSLANTVWETALQDHVPSNALSRVSAYDWLCSFTSLPIGYTLAGAVAGPLGTRNTLWLGAAAMTVLTSGVLLVPDVRRLRRRGLPGEHVTG
jgi:MFS family permease